MSKNLSLLMVFGLFICSSAFATNTAVILAAKAYQYNTVWKKQFKTGYGLSVAESEFSKKEIKNIRFVVSDNMGAISFALAPEDRVKIQGFIKKYKEWNKKADKKGITLQKEIGSITVKTPMFRQYKKWHFSDDDLKVTFTFFSAMKGKHQLVMQFSGVADENNKYSKHDQDDLYYHWAQVKEFEKHLKESVIRKIASKEFKKQRNIASEFK
jgi:hypothetical protein